MPRILVEMRPDAPRNIRLTPKVGMPAVCPPYHKPFAIDEQFYDARFMRKVEIPAPVPKVTEPAPAPPVSAPEPAPEPPVQEPSPDMSPRLDPVLEAPIPEEGVVPPVLKSKSRPRKNRAAFNTRSDE